MNFTIDTRDLQALRADLAGFSDRRFRAALATALTRTAVQVRDAEKAELVDAFDRPTRYTLGAIYMQGANADALRAEVGVKDEAAGGRPPTKWLRWQISGGLRTQTAFERQLVRGGAMRDDQRMVPGEFARLDAFGNVSRGQLQQILSQLRIDNPVLGSNRAMVRRTAPINPGRGASKKYGREAVAASRKIRAAYSNAGGAFVAFPNGTRRLLPGIYQAEGRSFGRLGYGASGRIRPVLIFVSKAQYEAGRFDFHYVARLTVDRQLAAQVDVAVQEHLRRLSERNAQTR